MNTRLAVVVNLWAGWVWGIILKLFGSDRSPRRGNVVCASVRPSVRACVTLFKRTLKMSSSSILKCPGGPGGSRGLKRGLKSNGGKSDFFELQSRIDQGTWT